MSDFLTSGLNSTYLNNTHNTSSSTNALEKSLSSSDLSNSTDEELMSVCKEFEAYFLEQMFKSMQKMVPTSSDESSSSSMLTDYYKDEMTNEYAKTATTSNGGKGYGIAQTLYEQMKRNYSTSDVEL